MVLIWDITHHIKPVTERSHIIPIEKASEANEPLLWNIYGQLLPIVLPYKSFHRLSIPCTSHALKFHKTGHHIHPI